MNGELLDSAASFPGLDKARRSHKGPGPETRPRRARNAPETRPRIEESQARAEMRHLKNRRRPSPWPRIPAHSTGSRTMAVPRCSTRILPPNPATESCHRILPTNPATESCQRILPTHPATDFPAASYVDPILPRFSAPFLPPPNSHAYN
jgi:hypothetical protein